MLEVRRFARTQEDPMTDDRLPLPALLAKAGDGDFLRRVAEDVVQLLMETDMEGLIGAGRHECSGERTTYRNGYRDRSLDTRLGSLQLVDLQKYGLHLTVRSAVVVGVRRAEMSDHAACSNFSLATGSMSMKVCIGVLPKHHLP
jgi:hypothetical protein